MKKLIFLAITLLSFSTFGQTITWPQGLPCVKVGGLTEKGTYQQGVSQYSWFGKTFKEIEAYIATLTGKPLEEVKISFNYIQYRFGFHVLSKAEYSADCQFEEDDDQMKMIKEKSKTGSLTVDDFTGPRWLHVVQAIDVEEVNCLAISKVNGKVQGCGDIWQDGLQEDELVCIKGKTYPKCHIQCLEKIYNRSVEQTPGSCDPVGE